MNSLISPIIGYIVQLLSYNDSFRNKYPTKIDMPLNKKPKTEPNILVNYSRFLSWRIIIGYLNPYNY